jgi:transposase
MIPVPSGTRVWLAVGRTDMRRGMNGLALQVQEALRRDPHAGDLFVFRGARGPSQYLTDFRSALPLIQTGRGEPHRWQGWRGRISSVGSV